MIQRQLLKQYAINIRRFQQKADQRSNLLVAHQRQGVIQPEEQTMDDNGFGALFPLQKAGCAV